MDATKRLHTQHGFEQGACRADTPRSEWEKAFRTMQSHTAAVCSSSDSGQHRHHAPPNTDTQCCSPMHKALHLEWNQEPAGGRCESHNTHTHTLAHILLTVVVACPAVPQWQGCTRRAPLLLQPLSSLAIHTSRITLWSHTDC
jgi:hypothetical protein